MKKLILAGLIAALGMSLNAESFVLQDRAEVVRSKPIYRNVIKRVPYQECWDEQVPVESYYDDDSGNTIDNNFGALIGGVAGGILGHQIGGGSGKTAATVGGAIIGTLVGKNLSHKNHRRRYVSGYRTERKCVTKYSQTRDRVITRYKNVAYYQGRKIIKFSDRPLKFIQIRKIIEY
jgi:uncharacterized protein YcfJ